MESDDGVHWVRKSTPTGDDMKHDQEANLRYNGQIANNKPHGNGVMIYNPNVNTDFEGNPVLRFVGQFVKGQRSGGFGVLWCKNGQRWEGNWAKDFPDGIMERVTSDGSRYKGEFFADTAGGEMIYTSFDTSYSQRQNGILRERGTVCNGKWHGKKCLVWADGSRWEGHCRDGRWHGVLIRFLVDQTQWYDLYQDGSLLQSSRDENTIENLLPQFYAKYGKVEEVEDGDRKMDDVVPEQIDAENSKMVDE